MPNIHKDEFPGLHTVSVKGRTYYYAYRGGPRIKAAYGTPAFRDEFLTLRQSVASIVAADRSSFAYWVKRYRSYNGVREKGGRSWADLSPDTRRTWGPYLDQIEEDFGDIPIADFNDPAMAGQIENWLDRKWGNRRRRRACDVAKQVLSRVCSFVIDHHEAMTVNPCKTIKNLYKLGNRNRRTWSAERIALFCRANADYPEMVLALRLAALTGVRQSDLLELTWDKVSRLSITFKTRKSRYATAAVVPLYEGLRELLASLPRKAVTVLTDRDGQPWRRDSDGEWEKFKVAWRRAMARARKAGLDDETEGSGTGLHFHDLRGTAITNLYNAGLTQAEIAEIVGWKSEEVGGLLRLYLNDEAVLEDRIRRIEESQALRNRQNGPAVKLV